MRQRIRTVGVWMQSVLRQLKCHLNFAVIAVAAAILASPAQADPISTIDDFSDAGSLSPPGILAPPSTLIVNGGLSGVLGGTRVAVIQEESGNGSVTAKIIGGNRLQFNSQTNDADGLLTLLYSGQNNPFPADFSMNTGIDIGVFSHTNTGINTPPETDITVTITETVAAGGDTADLTINLNFQFSGGNQQLLPFSFVNFNNIGAIDLSQIASVQVDVDHILPGTNITLNGIQGATGPPLPPDPISLPIPEPGSILTWCVLGFGAATCLRRKRRPRVNT